MIKFKKILFLLIFLFAFTGTSHAQGAGPDSDADVIPVTPDTGGDPGVAPDCSTESSFRCRLQNMFSPSIPDATDPKTAKEIALKVRNGIFVAEFCSEYPGFFNKIVQCVTHLVTRDQVAKRLNQLNIEFAGASNVALILYIMFFGLKLSLNAVQDVRGEIIIVLVTCFFITYANNSVRMGKFIEFFVGLQNEFANVGTVAINDKLGSDPNVTNYVCYEPNNLNSSTIWNRIDCLLGYIIGAHPLVERMGQYYSKSGDAEASDLVDQNPSILANYDSKFSCDLFDKRSSGRNSDGSYETKPKPFANMAQDPYSFNRKACIDKALGLTVKPDGSTVDITSQADRDALITTAIDCETDDINNVTKPRPLKNDKVEVFMGFSLVIITVGLLFSDPTTGILLFITGLFIIVLFMAAFGQAAFIYITSLFAIVTLGLFAPIVLPLVLFDKTREIFNIWVQLLFAYSLQPGIVLCYLSFMILVLQNVIGYKAAIDAKYDTAAEGDNKPVTSGAFHNLADFHFGDLFCKGYNGDQAVIEMVETTASGDEDGYGRTMQQSQLLQRHGGRLPYRYYAMTNAVGKADPNKIVATETVTEGNSELRNNYLFRMTGTNMKTFKVPVFDFYVEQNDHGTFKPVANPRQESLNQAATYDFLNSDLQSSEANRLANENAISDPTQYLLNPSGAMTPPKQKMIDLTALFEQGNFDLKIAYMQLLLIILITLLITLAFMSNVLNFAGSMVGAGATPIGGGINLYSQVSNRLTKFMR